MMWVVVWQFAVVLEKVLSQLAVVYSYYLNGNTIGMSAIAELCLAEGHQAPTA
jgi:hypothetical protein